MKLRILHETVYSYSRPVQLNPHQLFLKPLARDYIRVQKHDLRISPDPSGLNERLSIEGNPYFQIWFDGAATELNILMEMVLETIMFNPFAFLIEPGFIRNINTRRQVVFSYTEEEQPLLKPYLEFVESPQMNAFVRDYLRDDDVLGFLTTLNTEIHQHWRHTTREEENVWSPGYTFEMKSGSCRDLAWMLAHMLRSVGLACRFVSGYAFNPDLEDGHELHAWIEVYLPGGGWLGIDPSLGLLTDHHYIPLACAHIPSRTLPVHGTVGGQTLTQSKLLAKVTIKRAH